MNGALHPRRSAPFLCPKKTNKIYENMRRFTDVGSPMGQGIPSYRRAAQTPGAFAPSVAIRIGAAGSPDADNRNSRPPGCRQPQLPTIWIPTIAILRRPDADCRKPPPPAAANRRLSAFERHRSTVIGAASSLDADYRHPAPPRRRSSKTSATRCRESTAVGV